MYQSYDDLDPNTALRSDMWSTMSVQELAHQQDLVLTKMSTLSQMLSPASPPQYLMLYNALQQALAAISHFMDVRSHPTSVQQNKDTNG